MRKCIKLHPDMIERDVKLRPFIFERNIEWGPSFSFFLSLHTEVILGKLT